MGNVYASINMYSTNIAGDLDVASGNHVTLPEWLNGLFSCCVINHGIHDNDDVSHHHMMLQAISIFCHLLEMSNTVISQELRLYIFHQTKFCQVRHMQTHTHTHTLTHSHTQHERMHTHKNFPCKTF